MTPTRFDLSVIVACFDEEEALPHLFAELARLAEACAGRDLALEVVAVDDGSADRTREILRSWAAAGPDRTVVVHPRNRGFGAALRTGLDAARGDVLVSYDADATYPVLDVLRLRDSLDGADVAGASPFAPGGVVAATPFRTMLSRGVALLYRIALRRRVRITAYTCAFRAYRREVLDQARFDADDFLAAAEILARLVIGGARVREIPSVLSRRRHGTSKMKVVRTALGHLSLLWRIAARRGRFRKSARRSRPGPPPPADAPADLAGWNAGLNRDHPMARIEHHGNPLVRTIERRRRREVIRLAAPRRGQTVLDIGAERGAYAGPIEARGARRVAFDIDPAVLREGAPGAGRVAGDAQRLPFSSRSVARVIVPETLEHCPSPARAAAEALRVVRVSGRVTFSVPDDEVIERVKGALRLLGLRPLLGGLPPGRAPGHLHVFRRASLERVLGAAGRLLSLRRDPAALAWFAVVAPRPEGS